MANLGVLEDGNEQRPKAPASRFGVRHVQILLFFVMLTISYGIRVTLSVGIVAMTDKKSSPNPDVPTYDWDNKNVILSSFYWGYIITQIPGGVFSRTYGAKWVLAVSLLVNSVICLVIPMVADNLGSRGVMGCRIVQGLGQGPIFPALHNLMGRWAPAPERSRTSTFVSSALPFSIMVVMPVTGVISGSWAGWPVSFYTLGGLGLGVTLIWVWLVASSPAEHKSISEEERKYIEATLGPKEDKKAPSPWKEILLSMPVWAITVAGIGLDWGYTTLLMEIPNYLNKVMNFDIESNGFLSAAPYFGFWAMTFVVGPIADYLINSEKMSRGSVRKLFNSFGSFIPAAALIWIGFVPDDQPVLTVVLLVVAVSANAGWICGFTVNEVDLSPNHAGVVTGIVNGISSIFAIPAPLAVHAIVYDETDQSLWRTIFITVACFYIGTNLFYIAFGSGELQRWNVVIEDETKQVEERKEQQQIDLGKI